MDIAALVLWILTALGGFVLLGTWVAHVGHRGASRSHLPSPVVFSHFGLAATGLVLWIIYVITDTTAVAWIAVAGLGIVAVLGFTMFARWLPSRRTTTQATAEAVAERHFPLPVVLGHGAFAATTIVLAVLAAANVGGGS